MEDIFKNVYEIHYKIKDTQEFGSLNLKWLHLLCKNDTVLIQIFQYIQAK